MIRYDSIRKEILFHLYAIRPAAHSLQSIAREARKNGLDYSEPAIRAELVFLMDEILVIPVEVPGSTEKLFRISAAGIRTYEQNYAS